jgi:hypothetical protein
MGMLQEFKEFAVRGNVVDMAVGIVIGAAFSKIVTSLVSDVIMPPIGWITGGIDFSAMKWVIRSADNSNPAHKIPEVAIGYGHLPLGEARQQVLHQGCGRNASRRGVADGNPRPAEKPAINPAIRATCRPA